MSHLAAPEHHRELHLVPFLQETPGVAELELVVVILDSRSELHLLDLDGVLFPARFPRGAGGLVYLYFP